MYNCFQLHHFITLSLICQLLSLSLSLFLSVYVYVIVNIHCESSIDIFFAGGFYAGKLGEIYNSVLRYKM